MPIRHADRFCPNFPMPSHTLFSMLHGLANGLKLPLSSCARPASLPVLLCMLDGQYSSRRYLADTPTEPKDDQSNQQEEQPMADQALQPNSQERSSTAAAVARSLLAQFDNPEVAVLDSRPSRRRRREVMQTQVSQPAVPVEEPLDTSDVFQVLMQAIENCKPSLKVKQVKTGTRVINIPFMVHPNEQRSLAIRWILQAAAKRKEASQAAKQRQTMAECLATELLLAAKKEGSARLKRDEMHRLAVENRANMLR